MKRVLFVDDDVQVLRGLRRLLSSFRDEWEMEFVDSGERALELMANRHFDVLVTDVRMPGMDGATLLDEVSRRFPYTVRIVLSGQADRRAVLRAVRPMHRFLAKPCDPAQLRETVRRGCELLELLSEQRLRELVCGLNTLPSPPDIYAELIEEVNSPECSAKRVGQIVAKDPAMATKVLQLANSALLGLPRPVTDPVQAAGLLGVEMLEGLVLAAHVFQSCERQAVPAQLLRAVTQHSLTVGTIARQICRHEKLDRTTCSEAFTAGLLHDVGKLVLLSSVPDQWLRLYEIAKRKNRSLWRIEREQIGASHQQVGAALLSTWGLPGRLVEAVAFHHDPGRCQTDSLDPLLIVCAAERLADGADEELGGQQEALQQDGSYAAITPLLDKWRSLCSAHDDDRPLPAARHGSSSCRHAWAAN